METYASQGSAFEAPFDSEAAAKEKAIVDNDWVRISVEGFNRWKVPEAEIEIKLIKHFESCGRVTRVVFPPERVLDKRAFVTINGDDAKEKALQLNGTDVGGWKAVVKIAPKKEEEEYQVESRYSESLLHELLDDKRFMFGITVLGYNPPLPKDEVEKALRTHFSSCGEIVHVYVNPVDKYTDIYFSKEEGEASAMDLDGSQVDGFEIMTMLIATTARCYAPPLESRVGACIPAHMLEFAHEMQEKIDLYMTEWRLNSMTKKLRALKKQKVWTIGEPKAKALKKPKAGAFKKLKAWAFKKRKAKAPKKQKARRESGHSPFEKEMMLM